ncbi:MAG: bifunctional glycosyltransferase/class I SAM-dependent methyltransferase [Acidimicrobiales bacterium]
MKKIGILVVAYNAASTLERVLDRIPEDFLPRITEILVCDDHSDDDTYEVGLGYQQANRALPLKLVRHARNLGYGGNQKEGYRWAIANDLDIVVLLHGDGQYAPELLPAIVAPLELDEADAVFGSRMMTRGEARKGGMPLYKYVGNRILTTFQNAVAGLDLTEWHSGYRAYSVAALEDIPFEVNSDDFDFDTQIIIQLHEAGKSIVEVPIPTYYGDEICYVNGMAYARDVAEEVLRYRAHKMGFGSGELAFADQAYEIKEALDSSHGLLLGWLERRRPGRVLDLGCSHGLLAMAARRMGHEVTGVDIEKHDGVVDRLDRFVEADLSLGIPGEVGAGYDVIVAADVLEHVPDPARLLGDIAGRLGPGGSLLVSVPNFAHWYPRVRVGLGLFDYDRRGILDRGHLRFFTRRSIETLLDRAGFVVRRREVTGLPFEVVDRGGAFGADVRGSGGLLQRIERVAVRTWPTLFGYQFVYEAQQVAGPPEGAEAVSPGGARRNERFATHGVDLSAQT